MEEIKINNNNNNNNNILAGSTCVLFSVLEVDDRLQI